MRSKVNRTIGLIILATILYGVEVSPQSTSQGKTDLTLEKLSDSFEVLAEKIRPAVVQVFTTGYGADTTASVSQGSLLTRQRTSGSGVIVDPDGYIVTNAHVVQGARRLQVLLPTSNSPGKSILRSKGKIVPAKLVGLDSETDLAVLKIQESGQSYVEMGDSDEVKLGQLVFAFGSPFGLENSVTMGVVSAVARQLRSEDPMIYIQTDTPMWFSARIADAPYVASGFRPGDVIHSFNRRLITSLSQLRSLVGQLKTGDPVVLQLERNSQLLFVALPPSKGTNVDGGTRPERGGVRSR